MDTIDELFEKRIIVLDKEIDEITSSELISKIILLNLENNNPIVLMINSFGGNPYCALGITDIIRNSSCPITTICIGVSMSAASMILAAGFKRYAVFNSRIMIHQHSEDEINSKTHTQLVNDAKESMSLYKQMENFYVEVTKQSRIKVKKILQKDSYFTTAEAIKFGIIDENMGTNVPWL